jgi:hypothetical protein
MLTIAVALSACERNRDVERPSMDTTMMQAVSTPTQAAAPPPRMLPQLRFEDYRVAHAALSRRRPAAVDLASAEYGRMYRTKLREGAAAGPNFAGYYTVVMWGCGTGCQVVAVVDARTGRLSRETLLTANGVRYRRDSRLLFADPPMPDQPAQCASCGTPAYYEWRRGRFEPVGPGPPSAPRRSTALADRVRAGRHSGDGVVHLRTADR